jgi:hypothetical protein
MVAAGLGAAMTAGRTLYGAAGVGGLSAGTGGGGFSKSSASMLGSLSQSISDRPFDAFKFDLNTSVNASRPQSSASMPSGRPRMEYDSRGGTMWAMYPNGAAISVADSRAYGQPPVGHGGPVIQAVSPGQAAWRDSWQGRRWGELMSKADRFGGTDQLHTVDQMEVDRLQRWAGGESAGSVGFEQLVFASARAAESYAQARMATYQPNGGTQTLANSRRLARPAMGSGNAYSVAFQVTLPRGTYPGRSREFHYQQANMAIIKVMDGDPAFAKQMDTLIPGIRRQIVGPESFIRSAPAGWTWHHHVDEGVMQLVPRIQHRAPGQLQQWFHPDGRGGMDKWGE